jgi:hypothetical protein
MEPDPMKPHSPRPGEQKKIEKLLLKLAKVKPISAKPAPIMRDLSTRKSA